VIVAIASNSSLCGGFNANAIAKVKELLRAYPKATVYSIGRKMADAMRKAGYPSPADYSSLSEHPSYGPADELASGLMKEVEEGRVGKVFLVYNHFVSSARQEPTIEVLIANGGENSLSSAKKIADATEREFSPANIAVATERESSPANITDATEREFSPSEDYILEPSAKEIRKRLYPKTIKLRLYATLLDSAAAEHAARTVAMQTATDNGEDLLDELTLQYNKGRQQKITSEILDLASGQQ
jgi:F-type H+-transporting ATPase subunit gamma